MQITINDCKIPNTFFGSCTFPLVCNVLNISSIGLDVPFQS